MPAMLDPALNYVLEPEAVASERGENFADDMSYMAEQASILAELHDEFSRITDVLIFAQRETLLFFF